MTYNVSIGGLNVADRKLDVIGTNVSNASTVGFKQSRSQFADIYVGMTANSGQVGASSMTTVTVQDFNQGGIRGTDNIFDMTIVGKGFYQVERSDGSLAYTRNGQFHIDANRYLVNAEGDKLMSSAGSPIQIDPNAWDKIQIGRAGVIEGMDGVTRGPSPGNDPVTGLPIPGELLYTSIATVGLSYFQNERGLQPIGDNLWAETQASGKVKTGAFGNSGLALLQSSAVEESNVDLNESLVGLIIAQREYQGNAQALKVQDEMERSLMKL